MIHSKFQVHQPYGTAEDVPDFGSSVCESTNISQTGKGPNKQDF